MKILSGAIIFNEGGRLHLIQQKEGGRRPILWGLPSPDPLTVSHYNKEEVNVTGV